MAETRGAALLLLLALAALSIPLGRVVLQDEGPPAFFLERRKGTIIALGEGFTRPGIHQISDEKDFPGVISLAPSLCNSLNRCEIGPLVPLRSGERLSLLPEMDKTLVLARDWMPAGQRIALGIPLHPDRMNWEDWLVLPGVGPRMAETIVRDRQENGDFGSWETLGRVKGIGDRRLATWREFFIAE